MKRKPKPRPRVEHQAGSTDAIRIVRAFIEQRQRGEVKLFTPPCDKRRLS